MFEPLQTETDLMTYVISRESAQFYQSTLVAYIMYSLNKFYKQNL